MGVVTVSCRDKAIDVKAVGKTARELRALVERELGLQGDDEPYIAGEAIPGDYELKANDVVSYYPKQGRKPSGS